MTCEACGERRGLALGLSRQLCAGCWEAQLIQRGTPPRRLLSLMQVLRGLEALQELRGTQTVRA